MRLPSAVLSVRTPDPVVDAASAVAVVRTGCRADCTASGTAAGQGSGLALWAGETALNSGLSAVVPRGTAAA